MVYTKTRKSFRKVVGKSDKHIMAVAKKAVMQVAETKSYLNNNSSSVLLDNTTYATNLIYGMSQGTTAETYIGEKIHLQSIRLKGFLYTSITSANTKMFRITVIRTKKALTSSSSFAAITGTDVYRPYSFIPQAHVDLHKVDSLYDRIYTLQPQISSGVVQQPFDIRVKINRKETWDADNSGYLKNKNYYLVVTGYDTSGASYPVSCVCEWAVNFKDE